MKKPNLKTKIMQTSALFAIATCSLSITPAFSENSDDAKRSVLSLDEIVVTARKRAETIQSVPVSAVVFSGDHIASRGITSV